MISEIKLFLFVLSMVFELRFISTFIYQLTRETPEELKISEVEKTLLYFATAYIITFILI